MPDVLNKEKILEHAKKLTSEGKFDRAITEYEKLLQADPGDLRIKIKIAELYIKRKQIQNAISLYRDVALKYTEGGFYLKAVTVYKNILRLNPGLIDINTTLAELYEKMGLVSDALNQYQIVAICTEQKGDHPGTLAIREKMLSLDPSNISLQSRMAEAYQLEGMADKAIDIYEALANQIKKSGQTDQLIELYNKILSHRPERHDLLKELCRMYFKRGEWKEIIKKMDAAKEVVAADAFLLGMQADIYVRLNQTETGKGKYRDLAEFLTKNGDIDGAIQAYENIVFLSPEDEEDVLKVVEELKEGSSDDVKHHMEERRKKAADEDEEVKEEVKEKSSSSIKGAMASFDLGMMYKKMGLVNEANAEFEKVAAACRSAIAGGGGGREATALFEAVKSEFGESAAVGEPAKPAQPAPKAHPPPAEAKPAQTPSQSKKKISFV